MRVCSLAYDHAEAYAFFGGGRAAAAAYLVLSFNFCAFYRRKKLHVRTEWMRCTLLLPYTKKGHYLSCSQVGGCIRLCVCCVCVCVCV